MNDQETFWAGHEGDAYTARCPGDVPSNLAFFAKALARADVPSRIIELGAGSGSNLVALQNLYPHAYTLGIDVNQRAVEAMQLRGVEARQGPIGAYFDPPLGTFDLVLTKGLLIHLDGLALEEAYETILGTADRYILLAEYYSPTRRQIRYREREDLLWLDDYATHLVHRSGASGLIHLVDYGFVYHGDPQPQDDLTWFLLERI